ncbi:hypothetical protein AB1Y20_019005 [Prymnesium parvum]|uniref:Calcineurin-like phosphoesterase domain-containing protein n=1 Tax=Prymnesium parvum TaxID=97485 RepID=A0AB34JTS2_PRYPA
MAGALSTPLPSDASASCADGTNRSFIIGDVHGCIDELRTMLRSLRPARRCGDRLIFVGDVVGKGPWPLETLRTVRQSVDAVGGQLVLGNHEASVLRWLSQREAGLPENQRHCVSRANKALAEALSEEEVAWLRRRPHFVWLAEHGIAVVHAGFAPGVPLSQQRAEHMLTMRSLSVDGVPSPRLGAAPWATQWQGPYRVVFGHDARRGLQQHALATGIDTGCVYGGNLTALIIRSSGETSMAHVRSYATWCVPGSRSRWHGSESRSSNCH